MTQSFGFPARRRTPTSVTPRPPEPPKVCSVCMVREAWHRATGRCLRCYVEVLTQESSSQKRGRCCRCGLVRHLVAAGLCAQCSELPEAPLRVCVGCGADTGSPGRLRCGQCRRAVNAAARNERKRRKRRAAQEHLPGP